MTTTTLCVLPKHLSIMFSYNYFAIYKHSWLNYLFVLLFTAYAAAAATFTSVRNGMFYDPCTWANLAGCPGTSPAPVLGVNVPGPFDDVVIDHDVTFNTCYQFNIRSLTVNGNKTFRIAGTSTCYSRLVIGGSVGICALVLGNSANFLLDFNGIVDVSGGLCVSNSGNNLVRTTSNTATVGGTLTVRGCYAQGGSRSVGSSMSGGGACNANPVLLPVEYCIDCRSCPTCQCGGSDLTGSGTVNQTCARLLPVEWLSVNARLEKGNVVLTWATAWEIENYKFEVQRSIDGYNFSTIGEVATLQMNSSQVNEYRYTDTQVPNQRLVYYRLRQVDIDGKSSLSRVVAINKEFHPSSCKIYPNPSATGSIYIDIDGDASNWLLVRYLTPQGKVVLEEELAGDISKTTTLFTPKQPLPKGLYMVWVSTASHSFVHKLLIGTD